MEARTAGRRMTELLRLASRPVAVTFTATASAGVPRVDRAGPADGAYWKQAAGGAVFYTEADVVERLETVMDANRALETYHEGCGRPSRWGS